MEVLEREDERPLVRQLLEELAPGAEGFAPLVLAVRGPEPHQRSKMREEPVGLVHVPNRRAELLFCGLSRIRFEHPGLRLDHLTEGPEAHPFAVWEGAAVPPPDELRSRLDDLEELVDESALAD